MSCLASSNGDRIQTRPLSILVGTDIVDIDRFRATLRRRPALVRRLFTESEISYLRLRSDPVPSYAARFAAKEAVMKLLGKGIGGVSFQDVEVFNAPSKRPSVKLFGSASHLANELGVSRIDISLAHSAISAVATAVAMADEEFSAYNDHRHGGELC